MKGRASAFFRLGGNTPLDEDPVSSRYFRDVGTIKILSPEAEATFLARAKSGDASAKEAVIQSNLRLVVKIASNYQTRSMNLLDLVNEGNLGLMKAVETFDPGKGGEWKTYLHFTVKHAIHTALNRSARTIRIPTHWLTAMRKLERLETEIEQEQADTPTNAQLASRLGCSEKRIQQLKDFSSTPASFDNPVKSDEEADGESLAQKLEDQRVEPPDKTIDRSQIGALIQGWLDNLKPNQAAVIRSRFGFESEGKCLTLQETGKRMGITHQRVQSIQNQAIKTLRKLSAGHLDEGDHLVYCE